MLYRKLGNFRVKKFHVFIVQYVYNSLFTTCPIYTYYILAVFVVNLISLF